MKNAEIVIVHGVGAHQPNWSATLQGELSKQLQARGTNCNCSEVIYTDIVEQSAQLQTASEDPDDKQDEQTIQIDLARVDASIEAELGPQTVAQIESQSLFKNGLRKTLYDVNHYAVHYLRKRRLRAAINDAVLNATRTIAAAAKTANAELILVGHSLGSVIIWNLVADQDCYLAGRVSCLVTLASPLGWLKFAGVLNPVPVRTRWIAAGTPGDLVCHKSINDPPFQTAYGLTSIWTRRYDKDPHSGLLNDHEVISDWAPMLS